MNSHPSGRPGDMSGRTAVVSGASSGIGLAIVRRFLEAARPFTDWPGVAI